MERYLTILEVSQKQAFIFASNKLSENIHNSAVIAEITSPAYFEEVIHDPALFNTKDNLVYAGGGHTILEFSSPDRARDCVFRITKQIGDAIPQIEVFSKTIPYDETKTPGDNLKDLTAALEKKKAVRSASFHQGTFGVEEIDANTLKPRYQNSFPKIDTEDVSRVESVMDPDHHRPVSKLEELGCDKGNSAFAAIVHIDGNGMGKRVEQYYENHKDEAWETYKKGLRTFSEAIAADFRATFKDMVDTVETDLDAGALSDLNLKENNFPIRRLITEGDDICFITEGRIGIECARIFLEKLASRKNRADGQGYSACAGVAIVHVKYPFYRAYKLAEALCSNAKNFGASLDPEGNGREISSIDWHIEYGEIHDSLDETKKMYEGADGIRMDLRPYIVNAPSDILEKEKIRQYRNFRRLVTRIQNSESGDSIQFARGKLKELRSVLRRGEKETNYFIRFNKLEDLGLTGYRGVYTEDSGPALFRGEGSRPVYFGKTADGRNRSLLFDAIEISDTFIALDS